MKNKTFFLLFALMLGFATVNAQSNDEKYDYAFVEFIGKEVCISTTDGMFEKKYVGENVQSRADKKDFLNIIKEMNNKGWQVINAECQVGAIIYFLQKKRTN